MNVAMQAIAIAMGYKKTRVNRKSGRISLLNMKINHERKRQGVGMQVLQVWHVNSPTWASRYLERT